VERLLKAVGAPEVETVRKERQTLIREEVSEEMNRATKAMMSRRNFAETLAIYVVCAAALSYEAINR
jgi:hypothetical protein